MKATVKMKATIAAIAFVAANCAFAAGAANPAGSKGGDSVLGPWRLPKTARIENQVLTISAPLSATNSHNKAMAKIDLRPYLEKELHISMKVRCKNLVCPKKSRYHWLGAKFMLSYKNKVSGHTNYPGAPLPDDTGDFEGEFSMIVPLYGVEADYGNLCLGLEEASGEISFDLSTLRISAERSLFPPKNVGLKSKYTNLVAKRPVLRGAMVMPDLKEQDVADLASWGGRLMRYQFIFLREKGYSADKATKEESIAKFRRDAAKHLDYLENNVLGWARKYGMMVVVDMHTFPVGPKVEKGPRASIFGDDELFGAFRDEWKKIAARLKGNEDVIYGYDIINEPEQSAPQKYGYFGLQEQVAREIRKIDPVTPIVLESNGCCCPGSYYYMNALDLPDVIYQVHVYQPLTYTHQRVGSGRPNRLPYPSPATGNAPAIDKEYLRKTLVPVLKFQKEHGCRIYVGEFSAVAWAEGAAQYLDDLISLFEEYGWDWSYHAFREYPGWSVEHEASDYNNYRKAEKDTDRKKVLLKGFANGLRNRGRKSGRKTRKGKSL